MRLIFIMNRCFVLIMNQEVQDFRVAFAIHDSMKRYHLKWIKGEWNCYKNTIFIFIIIIIFCVSFVPQTANPYIREQVFVIAANCIWICKEEGQPCAGGTESEPTSRDQSERKIYGRRAYYNHSCRCCEGRRLQEICFWDHKCLWTRSVISPSLDWWMNIPWNW